ncbi:hypothetical protein ATANTOWER_003972, partial [Ataeniobius toweri]|nr:hypothetical protein [Ataeniobius toweri]
FCSLTTAHWEYKPESLFDVVLLSPDHHTEEPKFSLLIPQRILKRGSCACRWWFSADRFPELSINLLNLTCCVRLKFLVLSYSLHKP